MRMIPGYIDEAAPPGEVAVFRKLESAGSNWTVIHALDLAPYNRHRRTELDFVILIPDIGILCVEVKSQREIGFDGERWYPDSISRSPFRQAQDARYALHRRLAERLASFAHVPVVHCCIFPKADFAVPANMSVQPFEVMDRGRFEACATGDQFCDALKRMARRIVDSDPVIRPLNASLTALQIESLVSFCFPIRMRRPEKETESRYREEELEKLLRDQQRPVMQLTQYNQRVLVEGGAGTGKSLIGLEVARRKAAEGRRVGYLCFNRLIGQWAARELEADRHPHLAGGSAYSMLMSLTGIEPPVKPDAEFWSDLPLQIQDRLTDPACAQDARFDYLIIDEAQDILGRPDLLDCIGLLLDKGIAEGNYLMLGDFRNQVLTNASGVKSNLEAVGGRAARWMLTENCRNYQSIGEAAMTLSKAEPDTYSGYLRHGGGLETWQLALYEDEKDQVQRISTCISQAVASGFREDDITILAFGAQQQSLLSQLHESSARHFVPAGAAAKTGVRFSTVSAFKGMESKVVIIADVMPSETGFDRSRFYTGITRARERLYLFCHQSGKSQLAGWLSGKEQ
ncbi:NERD domain-containing protein [Cupriavidus sp. H39]|uniref:nuclease-related domain-containing DEAD/DEAH box helicase n=1 Tax=Cupriavidus sp. H39 TaxID=3401635 RepID=UPI003CFC5836